MRYLKRFGRPTFRIVNPFIGIKLLRSIYKLLSLAQVNKLFQKQFGIVLLKTDNLTNWEDWEREFFYSIHRHEFTEMMDQEHVSHALTIMDALNYNLAAFRFLFSETKTNDLQRAALASSCVEYLKLLSKKSEQLVRVI